MRNVWTIVQELRESFNTMLRIAHYNNEQKYRDNYLGNFWQFADPMLQIGIMVLMFAARQGQTENNPHAPGIIGAVTWIALGMVTYFYMQSSMLKSSKSIQRQMRLLARMKFNLSAIPLTDIITELRRYFIMMVVVMLGIVFGLGVWPSLWWLQYFYYFFAMIIFLYALSLVTSTVSVLIPDFYNAYAAILRVGMWVSGVVISIDSPPLPETISQILKLNPLYYIIKGMRETLMLNPVGFWDNMTLTCIFWGIVSIFLIVGVHIHMRFRDRFLDFI